MEEVIRQRIAELKAERDAFVVQANQQIAAYMGAIGELEKLLTNEPAPANGTLPELAQPAP